MKLNPKVSSCGIESSTRCVSWWLSRFFASGILMLSTSRVTAMANTPSEKFSSLTLFILFAKYTYDNLNFVKRQLYLFVSLLEMDRIVSSKLSEIRILCQEHKVRE